MSDEQIIDAPDVDSPEAGGNDVETQAREQGWAPLEEYKGDPKRWRSAEEFLEFGERVNPIIKKQRDEYKADLKAMEAKFEKQQEHVSKLLEFRSKQEQERYEGELSYLKTQLRDARRAGEDETVEVIEEKLDELKGNAPIKYEVEKAPEQHSDNTVEFQEWRSKNDTWFEKDDKATMYALGLANKMVTEKTTLRGEAFFNEISRKVKSEFPSLFSPKRGMVEASSNGGSRPAPRASYERLPQEAKDACDDYVNAKLGTREDYIKLFNR